MSHFNNTFFSGPRISQPYGPSEKECKGEIKELCSSLAIFGAIFVPKKRLDKY